MKKRFKWGLLILLFGSSNSLWAYTQPCQLVNQMAGMEDYQTKPMRLATMTPPDELSRKFELPLLERHGSWFIYQTPQAWYGKEQCAPLVKNGVEFMPVLLNRHTGHNAVLTGTFLLKVYRSRHLKPVIERYGLKLITYLPKSDSAIVDVRPVDSYDKLIERLDIDRDVQLIAPIFSEPRWKKK